MSSLIALALLASSALAAPAHTEASTLQWKWQEGVHHRFYIENEVHLPTVVMLYRERNLEARMVAYQAQLILDCTLREERRREWEIDCLIEELSFVGATLAGDRGHLGLVLAELDERLTGATLQIILRRDGQVRHVDLEGVDRSNRRISQNAETLRLLLLRAVSAFDLRLPQTVEDEAQGWAQFESLLMGTPHNRGTQGAGELVHRVRSTDGSQVVINTVGRGSVAPATDGGTGPANVYMMDLETTSRFDRESGMLVRRTWAVIGTPTAGSAVNDGVRGVTYLQAGQLVYLPEGVETPVLWPTREASVPGARAASAIEVWTPIPVLGPGL